MSSQSRYFSRVQLQGRFSLRVRDSRGLELLFEERQTKVCLQLLR